MDLVGMQHLGLFGTIFQRGVLNIVENRMDGI